ncbi:MAG: hypothetical protein QOG23_3741 [Blastocatellia bacterium]|nr:hypothetical protein [Blastocatellia bacterium]
MTQFERKSVIVELAILSLTLIVTITTGLGLYYQTTRHFDIERTTYMSERLNTKELVDARDVTDKWLDTKEDAKSLMDRAFDPYSQKLELQKTEEEKLASAKAREAAEIVKSIRVFCNFFQELGTAEKHYTLDEGYMWDAFGALVTKYGEELKPFVEELRVRRHRPQLMQEFFALTIKMKELNKKYAEK